MARSPDEEGEGRKHKSSRDKDRKKEHKKKKDKKRKRDDDGGDTDREKEKEERRLVKKAKAFLKEQEKEAAAAKKKDSKKKDKKKKSSKNKGKRAAASDDEGDAAPPRRAQVPIVLRAEDDYYKRQMEFRVWLKLAKRVAFESLGREEAQALFEKFCGRWNKGQLEDMYYDGIPAHVQTQCHQTEHRWGFASKLSEEEKFQLERTGNRIAATTAAPVPGSSAAAQAQPQPRAHAAPGSAADAQYAREARGEREAAARRGVQGATREKARAVLEEAVGGKATGREALLAARHAKADRLHGAARAREESRDGLDVPESMLMGGGGREGDETRRRMERQRERQAQKAGDRDRRIEELKTKEEEKVKNLLATLGLKPGQRVVIPPRQPQG